MSAELFSLEQFVLFTFTTTTHALKAEKILLGLSAEIAVMPTLREITAGCGLSIKMKLENAKQYYTCLATHSIPLESAYIVDKTKNRYVVEPISII